MIEKEYTKEMREWIRVDIELRYIDADFEYLSDLASFLDLRFKFEYLKDLARDLEEVESNLSICLIFCQVDNYLAFCSSLVE